MINGLKAYDTQTGRYLSQDDAEAAADNPGIYTWVVWVA